MSTSLPAIGLLQETLQAFFFKTVGASSGDQPEHPAPWLSTPALPARAKDTPRCPWQPQGL